MKLFNIAKLAFALIVASSVASCSDDGYWDDATKGLANQVSFRTTGASGTFKEGEVVPSVTATLMRGTSNGTETVELTQESTTPGNFGVPASVTFADGETTTDVVITLKDMVAGERGTTYKTVVTAANASVSGNKSFTVTITVQGESLPADWQPIGEGIYREDCMTTYFNVENVSYKVPMEEDKNHPGVYRLVNPYGELYVYNDPGDWDDSEDHYLVINASDPKKVYIEQSHTGMAWSDYGEVIIWSIAGLRIAQGREDVITAGQWGTLADGIITFPASTLLIRMDDYTEEGSYNYANANGKFAVALPGYSLGDFSFTLDYVGRYIDAENNEYAVAQVDLTGKDAKSAVVGVVATPNANTAIEAVQDSTVEQFVVAAPGGEVRLPLGKSGTYTIAAISCDSEGGYQEKLAVTFKFTSIADMGVDPNKGWKSLGKGIYTDNLICNIFNGLEPVSYEVEIQEKEDQAGYYRMVNPYGEAYPYNEEGDYDPDTNYYIEIDATNPNCVMIPYQETGFDWGYGMLMIYSYASYFYENGNSLAEIEAAGRCGHLSEGVISFAEKEILFSMSGLQNGNLLVCPAGFELVLPSAPVPAPPMLAPKKVSAKNIVSGFVKAALTANNAVTPAINNNRQFHAPSTSLVSEF